MRYLVRANLKPEQDAALLQAIEDRTLGMGSVAGGEYLRNMAQARQLHDGSVRCVGWRCVIVRFRWRKRPPIRKSILS